MKILGSSVGAALAGMASWTAAEYGLHRFAMHEMRGRGQPSIEQDRADAFANTAPVTG